MQGVENYGNYLKKRLKVSYEQNLFAEQKLCRKHRFNDILVLPLFSSSLMIHLVSMQVFGTKNKKGAYNMERR